MTLEKLNYYSKIGDIANQILDIKEKARTGKKVSTLGLPASFTPEELIDFQFERMRILEVATRCGEGQILNWISEARKRDIRDEKDKFKRDAEVNLLEMGITK